MRKLKYKHRPGTAVSAKGTDRIDKIMTAARDVLINQGYAGFTMRAVAVECGISVGNLNYYYRSKPDLLSDLLDTVITGYVNEFDVILAGSLESPELALEETIRFIIDDLGTKETTVFFPELWALSNHDSKAARQMHSLYAKARQNFDELIPKINPTLSTRQVKQLSLFLSASIEGHTMFAGYRKPWAGQRRQIKNIAAKSLVDLVKNIQSREIEKED